LDLGDSWGRWSVFEAMVDRARHPGALRVRLDHDFCRDVADAHDRAPTLALDEDLARGYQALQRESRTQFDLLVRDGLRVEPWRGAGPPYRDSTELRREVRATRMLKLHLTEDGHGPGGGASEDHPMRAFSGVEIGGVRLCHNDVFRVVHDVLGHVVFGNGFGPRGEFKATYLHMRMYPEAAHPVLFTEQVGQICWFFFGPHLRDAGGALRAPDDPAYVPADRRPYPEQKVFAFDRHYLERFTALFTTEEER
jgi:hypothetical protein